MTVSEIAILRSVAARIGVELKIEILDWADEIESYVEGPDIVVRDLVRKTLLSPKGYYRFVKNSDMVIDIGAGDSFADIYGPRRLTKMMLLKYLTHISGTPLVLGPQTYGPFTRPLSTWLTRGTLRRSALVASRDQMSTSAVKDIAANVDVIEASDVALRLPYDKPTPRAPGGPVKVGLNISGLLMKGGYTGQNMFGLGIDYPQMIRTLVQRLLDAGAEVHMVPHVIPAERGGVEDDVQPGIDLQKDFPQLVLAPAFKEPSEAKSYIAGLDFFSGARMHACIAAFSSGVPVVPMAYSRKFEGLFGTLGYNRVVDCISESAEDIIAKVMLGFEQRDVLAAEMAPAMAKGIEKLAHYEDGLEQVMLQALERKQGGRPMAVPRAAE